MLTTSESALAFVVGALLFATGAILIFVVWRQYAKQVGEAATESLLAPVLAVDTLDQRLRPLWVKSMLIEAEAGPPDEADAARLSRELRRGLVALQVELMKRDDDSTAEFLGLLRQTLSQTLRQLRTGERPDYATAAKILARKRTALDESSRAAEPERLARDARRTSQK